MAKAKQKKTHEETLVEQYLDKRAELECVKQELNDLESQVEVLWRDELGADVSRMIGGKLKVKTTVTPKIRVLSGGNFTANLKSALVKVLGLESKYVKTSHDVDVKLMNQRLKEDFELAKNLRESGLEIQEDTKVSFEPA